MSINKAIILGNVTRDPEIKTMLNGNEVANFSIATSEKWTDKQSGEKKERAEFHKVVIFSSGLAGIVKNYVKKGSKLYIEGSLQTRKWTDKDNNDKYVTEIVLQGYGCSLQLLDSRDPHSTPKTDEEATREFADRNGGTVLPAGLVKQEDEFEGEIEDDSIPF